MKKVGRVVVAIFEILSGLGGFVMVGAAFAGIVPYDPVPILWFGIFPLLSIIAGVMLLLRMRHAYNLSRIVLALQIPLIVLSGTNILRLGLAANLYLHGIWNGTGSEGPTALGLNFLALGMLILLIWSRSSLEPNPETNGFGLAPPPPPVFETEENGPDE